MEFETHRPEGFIEAPSTALLDPKSKTALRMRYEAEVEVIKKQIGDLEKIRANLGLSARKICQLLLVDPSAWNRWTKQQEKAPPHIYRALQWYFVMNEKVPGLTPQYFIGGNSLQAGGIASLQMREETEKIRAKLHLELAAKDDNLENEAKEREKLQVRMEYYKVITEKGFRDLTEQVSALERNLKGEKFKSLLLLILSALLAIFMVMHFLMK